MGMVKVIARDATSITNLADSAVQRRLDSHGRIANSVVCNRFRLDGVFSNFQLWRCFR